MIIHFLRAAGRRAYQTKLTRDLIGAFSNSSGSSGYESSPNQTSPTDAARRSKGIKPLFFLNISIRKNIMVVYKHHINDYFIQKSGNEEL